MKKATVLFMVILFHAMLYGQAGYRFLKLSSSPAYSSLADPCSLYIDNASSFVYNPAFLALNPSLSHSLSPVFKSMDLYLSYMKYFEGINQFSLFSAMDFKTLKKIGLGMNALYYGDIVNTFYRGQDSYGTGNSMTIISYNFFMGYGVSLSETVKAGINIKMPVENLGDETYMGLGTDLGFIYTTDKWNAGFVFNNIGLDIKGKGKGYYLPAEIKAGGNYNFFIDRNKINKMNVLIDLSKSLDEGSPGMGGGLQYSYRDIFFIRSGLLFNEDWYINLGCGLRYRNYKIDYAFDGRDLGYVHRFGLGVNLNFTGKQALEEEEIEFEETSDGRLVKISIVDRVLFDYNKSSLKGKSRVVLDRIVEFIKQEKDREVFIFGHTDAKGTTEYNIILSEKRARSVFQYFINKGIKKERIKVKGLGESIPVDSNITEKGRQKNRRVEIYLLRLSKEEKSDYDRYFYEGMDHFMKQGYDKAIENWEKAAKIDPVNIEIKDWIKKAQDAKKGSRRSK